MATVAEILKRLREAAGLTQVVLAERAGVSLGVLRDYEQGKKLPGLLAALAITNVLGASCEEFRGCADLAQKAPPKKPTRKRRKQK